MNTVLTTNLGRSNYTAAWELQRRINSLRIEGLIPDMMLLTEHEHVFTFGKSSDENHLLANHAGLKANGIDIVHTDRGGDVTYHGPGQLVSYPIINLNNHYHDVHRYLRDIEEVVILTLNEFNIRGKRDPEYTGVWVGNDKIAAIGVKVNRWVTMHGVALNVNTDLSYFNRIIPCGIFHKGVTSIKEITGVDINVESVSEVLMQKFSKVFNSTIIFTSIRELESVLNTSQQKSMECLDTVNL